MQKTIVKFLGGGAIAAVAGFADSQNPLAVSLAVTAVVVGVVGFVIFLLRALSAWRSRLG
jgi:hypothetical protein